MPLHARLWLLAAVFSTMYKHDIRQLSGFSNLVCEPYHVLATERVLERDLKHHFNSLRTHVEPGRSPLTLKFTPHPEPQNPASTRAPARSECCASSSSSSFPPSSLLLPSPPCPSPLLISQFLTLPSFCSTEDQSLEFVHTAIAVLPTPEQHSDSLD